MIIFNCTEVVVVFFTRFTSTSAPSALVALAAHHDPRSIKLTAKFLNSKNVTLIKNALRAAEILKSTELEKDVLALLENPVTMIRLQAMESAFKLRLDGLEDRLGKLTRDPAWYVRERLAQLISKHKLARKLIPALLKDSNASVRHSANIADHSHIQPA